MTTLPDSELLTRAEVCELLGIHANTLHRWAREGLIPYVRAHDTAHRRYRRADVVRMAAIRPPVAPRG